MHFFQFITTQINKGQDSYIDQVIELIKNDADFPKQTSDPTPIAIYLYLKLNEKQTAAYQKLLMLYQQLVPQHKLPKPTTARDDMFLTAINLIVFLQNNDQNYKFHSI